ncbi:hypothetical protein BD626DRAFT_492756 [Schizophyllum amplum]|uniref:Uncharacterized protein n=1 Tax=Schizophyllum amplum TaxID=97359 RepID=A0A550CG75_9AGAR|nr:hypothetical protein BD626DRAFT_492756 [Auriculariopsis ampla]
MSFDIDTQRSGPVCERQEVAALQDGQRSLVTAPVHRLVPDVLLEIFITATRSEYEYSQLSTARTISRVSTFWRRLARDTPQLWTCVAVSSRRDLELYMAHYFSLTGDSALDLCCDSAAVVQLFLDTLRPYASRWRSVSIIGQAGAFRPSRGDPFITPNLRLLRIMNDQGLDEEGLLSCFDAPRLQELTLGIAGVTSDHVFVLRSASRALTRVSINAMTSFPVAHVIPLLQQCGATLQRLDINMPPLPLSFEAMPTGPVRNVCAMHSLTALELGYEACALLSYIDAPHLIELRVFDTPSYFLEVFLDYATLHSLPHLTRLRIDISDSAFDVDTGPGLIRVLERLNALEELYIANSTVSEKFLRYLVCRDGVPPLVPNLRAMDLLNGYEGWIPDRIAKVQREVYASRAKRRRICGTTVAALDAVGKSVLDEFLDMVDSSEQSIGVS